MFKRDGNRKYAVVEHECRKIKKKGGNNQMMHHPHSQTHGANYFEDSNWSSRSTVSHRFIKEQMLWSQSLALKRENGHFVL